MTAPAWQHFMQVIMGRLLNAAAEGVVVAVVTWLLLRVIGRRNSGTRFVIWFAALLSIAGLPFFPGSGVIATLPALPLGHLHGEIVLPGSWAVYLFAAWAGVASLLLLRLSWGLWRVHALRGDCSGLDLAALDPGVIAALREFGSQRRVELCASHQVAVPAAIGFFRPAIVFPARLVPQLSAEEFKVILLHELAHLRRRDDWTNLAQKAAKAVFFFCPSIWWIEKRLTLEREMACDDMVLAQTASPRAYAASLISFAEKLQHAKGLAMAQAIVSRMREMSVRIAQILDAKRPRQTAFWKPLLGASAGMLALAVAAAWYAPQFVAFQTLPKPDQARQSRPAAPGAKPAVLSAATGAAGYAQPIANLGEPKMIQAEFHAGREALPLRLKTTPPRAPALMRAKATAPERPTRETFFILQTTQFDDSGSAVWTLCIWKVGEGNSADKEWRSAIVLSLI